jgi:hypothetical protein
MEVFAGLRPPEDYRRNHSANVQSPTMIDDGRRPTHAKCAGLCGTSGTKQFGIVMAYATRASRTFTVTRPAMRSWGGLAGM